MVSSERDVDNMTDTLITLTIYLFCGLCFIQPTLSRSVIAGVFVFFIMSHELVDYQISRMEESGLDEDVVAHLYYISAALIDLLIISIITKISLASKLCFQLQLICLASIFINALGWYMWFNEYSPALYNWCVVAINFYAVHCMAAGGRRHGRLETDNNSFPFVLGYFNDSHKSHIKL